MTHILPPRRRTPALPVLAALPPHGTPSDSAWFPSVKTDAAVDALLSSLPPDWAVFNPIPAATTSVQTEHLIVGPGGVFTINIHHHTGEWVWVDKHGMLVSGRRTPYILDAEAEAQRVTKLLRERMPMRTPVHPVIALVGARFLVVRGKPTPVKILGARDLQEWLVGLPPVLRPIERMELAAVIDNPVTWGTRPSIGEGHTGSDGPPLR